MRRRLASLQIDHDLDYVWRSRSRILECLDAIGEGKSLGNKRLHIDLSRRDKIDGTLIVIRIPENRIHHDLFYLTSDDIERHRSLRHADEDYLAARPAIRRRGLGV